MADEKLSTGPETAKNKEAPAPVAADPARSEAPAPEHQPEQAGPAEPGDVVISADQIDALMADKRRARRESDPGLQPERTSLAWFRTLLGYAALMALAIILFGWLANVAPKEFLGHFTVFALSCVVGYYVVWNVSHALHTPLMSVTNAISGIIVVGALLQIGHGGWVSFLSFIAVLIASINIFGGFTVTQRMLKMFRKG